MKVGEDVLRLVIEYVSKMQFQNVGMILGQSAKSETAVDRIILIEIGAEIPSSFLKEIAPPFALCRAGEEKEDHLSSDSLLLPKQAENSSQVHVPAEAVPAVRRSNRVKKLPVRFAQ
jgi:hypothetical protein